MTIAIPDNLRAQLEREAAADQCSIEDVAIDILTRAFEGVRHVVRPEDVVARIKATPYSRPLEADPSSLAEALRSGPDDPDFDLSRWNREWLAAETEIDALARSDDSPE